jgi:hypothetical protein
MHRKSNQFTYGSSRYQTVGSTSSRIPPSTASAGQGGFGPVPDQIALQPGRLAIGILSPTVSLTIGVCARQLYVIGQSIDLLSGGQF